VSKHPCRALREERILDRIGEDGLRWEGLQLNELKLLLTHEDLSQHKRHLSRRNEVLHALLQILIDSTELLFPAGLSDTALLVRVGGQLIGELLGFALEDVDLFL
jgi:hypothetical protein